MDVVRGASVGVGSFWLILSVAVVFFVGWGIAGFLERRRNTPKR